MNAPHLNPFRHGIRIAVATALATLVAIGMLGAVTVLFQSRGLPLEELAAAERACSRHPHVSEREECIRERIAARGNRMAKQ